MSEKQAADALPVSLDADGHVVVAIRVIPRASRNRIDGLRHGSLLIRLAAPPVDGAANDSLIAFLSDLLACPRRNIQVASGEKSRDKRVRIEGLSRDVVCARLLG
jgi:uncharacterized protein (TIGR00251 family)